MPRLTTEEIAKIREQLYDLKRRDRLEKIQKRVVEIFQKWRGQEGRKYIRFIYPREDIKTLDSVVVKINRERREGDPNFNFKDIDDLIGLKILCPYPTDEEAVVQWLFNSAQDFSVKPSRQKATKQRREREKERGYRAYHFYVQLKKGYARKEGFPQGSEEEKCEVQIKTILDEAWDAKTHDVSYKRENIKPELRDHMKLVSRSLSVLDEQTELLKNEILEEELEESQRREAAKIALLTTLVPEEKRAKLGFPENKQIEELTEKDIQKIEDKIEKIPKHKISSLECNALTLVALGTNSYYIEETALQYANIPVQQSSSDANLLADSLFNRAFIRWALGHIQEALSDISEAVKHKEKILYKADYIYYAWELGNLTKRQERTTKEYADEIESQLKVKSIPAHAKDSLGYFYIKSGKDVETIERGRQYLRQAYEEQRNTKYTHTAQAFYKLHDYIAVKRLKKLYEQKIPS